MSYYKQIGCLGYDKSKRPTINPIAGHLILAHTARCSWAIMLTVNVILFIYLLCMYSTY
jgi:hypothetical protein